MKQSSLNYFFNQKILSKLIIVEEKHIISEKEFGTFVRKIGNLSLGITIPKEICKKMELEDKSVVIIRIAKLSLENNEETTGGVKLL